MRFKRLFLSCFSLIVLAVVAAGCSTETGVGAAAGAGGGALVGEAVGHPVAGALLGGRVVLWSDTRSASKGIGEENREGFRAGHIWL